jgi:predicted unusual protein kinase regulating ubiquinone biosynthesis (AarF/ABC1/UbiB family)
VPPCRYTCLALQRSFALPTSELFTWIEEVPIACGSIGQVHRAMLSEKGAALTGCDAGDTVAVKVRVCEVSWVVVLAPRRRHGGVIMHTHSHL